MGSSAGQGPAWLQGVTSGGGPEEGMGGARHASKAPDGYSCLDRPPRGPARPLTEPQNRIQGHVLPDVSQGGHRQLVCQVQGRSEIEAVTWGGEGGAAGEWQPLGQDTWGEGSRQGWQSALGMAMARGTAPRSRPGGRRWGEGLTNVVFQRHCLALL